MISNPNLLNTIAECRRRRVKAGAKVAVSLTAKLSRPVNGRRAQYERVNSQSAKTGRRLCSRQILLAREWAPLAQIEGRFQRDFAGSPFRATLISGGALLDPPAVEPAATIK